jgi:hypothetical protein
MSVVEGPQTPHRSACATSAANTAARPEPPPATSGLSRPAHPRRERTRLDQWPVRSSRAAVDRAICLAAWSVIPAAAIPMDHRHPLVNPQASHGGEDLLAPVHRPPEQGDLGPQLLCAGTGRGIPDRAQLVDLLRERPSTR